jgi:eukaryotic-like serine/threonine-protein kinase
MRPAMEFGERLVDQGEIGRGGMGVVHRVLDRHIGRYAALKMPDEEQSPETLKRFLREAQIVGQLEHPNIVPIYDLALTPSGLPLHFTMKLIQGETLRDRVGRQKLVDRTEDDLVDLLQVLIKVCEAVSYAHGRGVIHRDLKPENVMIGTHGQVYVMDWGIAARFANVKAPGLEGAVDVEAEDEDGPQVIGTPQYMAPEQAWGRLSEIGPRTDVFALGAMLYFVLTGAAPHRAPTASEAWKLARSVPVAAPHEAAPDVPIPPRLAEVAMRALSPVLDDRHPSVDAFKADLERALRSGLWFATRTFTKGTRILVEGDEGDLAYIITRGACEAYRGAGEARVLLRRMGPGDVFGEMALLTEGKRRTATVEAVEDTTVTIVRRDWIARELGDDTWLGALVRTLAARFSELEARVARE